MSKVRPPLSTKIRHAILKRDGHKCVQCGAVPKDGAKLHVDHITPLALGGTDDPENLQTLCSTCNRGKGDSHPDAEPELKRRGRPPKRFGIVVPMHLSLAPQQPPPAPPTREDIYEARAAAVSDEGYACTDKQFRFRLTAIRCVQTTPKAAPPDWVVEHMAEHHEIVGLDEFETWMKDPAFERWFYAPLRWVPDDAWLEMQKGQVMRKLAAGVAEGDARAIDLFMSAAGMNKRAAQDQPTSVTEQIREFKEKGKSGARTPSPSASNLRMGKGE